MSLRETIKKVLKENINENREHSPQFRRRINLLKDFIYNSFPMLYPCDFGSFDHFMYAINSEIQEYSSGVYDTDDNNRTPDWLIYKEGIDFVEKYMVEDLKRHFDEMCAMEDDLNELNEVFDDIKGTPLYHKTSASRALDIINSDSLRSGSLPSGDYLSYDKRLANTKNQNAISFTRDKNWEPGHTIGIGLESPLEDADITFVVDRDKLRTKYRVEPFNYFGIEPDYEHKEKNDELEERVMTNEIYPLRKYIIDIIYNGDNPKIQRKINNYLNR